MQPAFFFALGNSQVQDKTQAREHLRKRGAEIHRILGQLTDGGENRMPNTTLVHRLEHTNHRFVTCRQEFASAAGHMV
ncbi:unnamed protein product [Strongylus vulgaris]|uniref:Uncharacterized protein n=1 Tax=Strongylus vulgaris TaxID=40348 RepID=A0A3P7JC66_STRVU|nr:unnamed protein product [Strongylus vulgaris]